MGIVLDDEYNVLLHVIRHNRKEVSKCKRKRQGDGLTEMKSMSPGQDLATFQIPRIKPLLNIARNA